MGRPKVYDDTLRERLIKEAGSMLEAEGYDAVSLRVLTKNVGTSTNAVYTLFGSKEALIAEVLVENIITKVEALKDVAEYECPDAQVMFLTAYYRHLATATPKLFRGVFAARKEIKNNGSSLGRVNPELLTVEERVIQPLRTACLRMTETKGLSVEDAERLAISLWATIHGLISLEIEGMLESQADDVSETYMRTVFALLNATASGGFPAIPDQARQSFCEGVQG